jgi:hypothetical protein
MDSHKIGKSAVSLAVITGCVLFLLAGLFVSDLLFGIGIFTIPTNPDQILEMARSRVHIGDERTNAIQGLSDAWFHTECRSPDSTTIRDLFFYGPHNRDDVIVVLVVSKEVDNKTLVVFVGCEENYMLHLYDDCTPSVSRAFEEGEATPIVTP